MTTKTVHEPTEEWVMEMFEQDEDVGFCIACGADYQRVEHDARKYECEDCGQSAVYGLMHFIGL